MNEVGRTAVINIKVESRIKSDAMLLSQELGLTLSSMINAFLRQAVRTRSVSFSINKEESLTPYALETLKSSEEDIKQNRVKSFYDADSIKTYLDELISADKSDDNISN